jgi:alpha-ribazole phosphatase
MQIYLIRHTTPVIEKGVCYGQTDLDLVHTFAEELAEIQALVPDYATLPFFASPLQRCTKLASALNPTAITLDTRLMELHFGKWEMQKWTALEGDDIQDWRSDFVHTRTPEGESYWDLHQRVTAFWRELIDRRLETVGIVTHFGVIQSILSNILHTPLDKTFRIEMSYGAVIRIQIREGGFYKIKFLRC